MMQRPLPMALCDFHLRQPKIVLVCGSAAGAAESYPLALAKCPDEVVALNRAIHYCGRETSTFVSYHAETLAEIVGDWVGRCYVEFPQAHPRCEVLETRNIFGGGGSGMMGLSVAFNELKATRAILCGVALDDPGYHQFRYCWHENAEWLSRHVDVVGGGWVASLFETLGEQMPSKTVWKKGPFRIIEVTWVINDKPPRTTWHLTELYKDYSVDRRYQHQVGDGFTSLESAIEFAEKQLTGDWCNV